MPGHGCGIRYKHGLFDQKIVDGYQVEFPEQWLLHENVWEVRRHDQAVEVSYFGSVEPLEIDGRLEFRHTNAEIIMAVPYDVPVVGYETSTVNTLRLWNAEPVPFPQNCKDILKYKRETEAVSEFYIQMIRMMRENTSFKTTVFPRISKFAKYRSNA